MLIRTMVLIAFLTVLGETIVFACAGLARMSFHAKEHAAVRSAFADAVRQAQQAAVNGTVPQPSATCAYTDEHGCQITIQTTIAQATPVPGAAPTACPATACTIYEQQNSHVNESRRSYAITENVVASNGDVMMSRAGTVSFRTFATPPYASLVGSLDQTLDSINTSGTGDDGGNASATATTLIHVQYQRAGGGASASGDVWQAQSQHPATASSSWSN